MARAVHAGLVILEAEWLDRQVRPHRVDAAHVVTVGEAKPLHTTRARA
jgi:hypothetical protein|eukprot:COSAG01_NODE_203_length_22128_cov_280.658359_3_plen_48_part_00